MTDAPFVCIFCGGPSWIDPSDQYPPPDYCTYEDHGYPPEVLGETEENYDECASAVE